MNEIELKLAIHPEATDTVLQALTTYLGGEPTIKQLKNCYFDTQDVALKQHKAAFRVRQLPEGYVQTLKTTGISQGGLSQRLEFEEAIPTGSIDYGLAAQFFEQAKLEQLDASQLKPVFETNFTRYIWLQETNSAQIELVLDVGNIITDERTLPIAEIECELKTGKPEALLDVWARLEDVVFAHTALVPFDISKAERGYQCFEGASLWQFFKPQVSDYGVSDKVIEGLLLQEVQVLQNVLIQVFMDETWLEEVFQQACIRVNHYLSLYSVLSSEKQVLVAELEQLTTNQITLDEAYIVEVAKFVSRLSRLIVTALLRADSKA